MTRTGPGIAICCGAVALLLLTGCGHPPEGDPDPHGTRAALAHEAQRMVLDSAQDVSTTFSGSMWARCHQDPDIPDRYGWTKFSEEVNFTVPDRAAKNVHADVAAKLSQTGWAAGTPQEVFPDEWWRTMPSGRQAVATLYLPYPSSSTWKLTIEVPAATHPYPC